MCRVAYGRGIGALTDRQRGLWERYRVFGAAQVAPRSERLWAEGAFDRESWQALADDGFWRIAVPERHGGEGGGLMDFLCAYGGMVAGARDFGWGMTVGSQVGVLSILLEHGTERQLKRWLEPLLTGSVAATAITEPSGGSDVSRVQTTAAKSNGGYVLNGQKAHITNGPVADVAIVLGRVEGLAPRDLTLFLVDHDTPGVSRGESEDMFGTRTSPTGALTFENALLDGEQVIGDPGDGMVNVARVMVFDRLQISLLCLGLMEPLVWEALAFAEQREAFKVKISEHQYIQGRITEMVRHTETTRFTTFGAIERVLSGDPAGPMTASLAKLHASEALVEVAQHAMAVLAHRAYVNGPISRVLADSLGGRIGGGTPEMQRKNIFNQLVKLRARHSEEERKWLESSPA